MLTDKRVATAFNALAHPRRVRLFRLLVEAPELGRSMTGLMEATGYKKAPLLHHLRVMQDAGLITRKQAGSNVAHALTPGALAAAIGEAARLATSATRPASAA